MTEPEPTHQAEPPPETATDAAPAAGQPTPPVGEPPAREDAPAGPARAAEPAARPAADVTVLAWLCGLGFLVLASAIAYVWWQPRPVESPDAAAWQDLRQQVQALETRVGQLEHQPGAGAALQQLADRVSALEKRPTADTTPLETRVAGLEQKTQDATGLAARIDALSGQVNTLSGRDQGTDTQLAQRLDAGSARLAALEQNVAQVSAEAKQAARRARLQAAAAALNAGQPLGEIAGAPIAVLRFAAAAPPTETALRLAFPKAAQAALVASQPDTAGKPFLSQLVARAESLVTVRQGDHVLIGDSAAGVLARARTALDAGDLAGAVAAVAALSGPAADAMAHWRADAQSLLDARAGLAAMGAHP